MIRFYAHWLLAFMCLGLGFAVSRGAQVQQASGEQARDPYQEDRDAPRAANPVAFRQDVEQAIAEAKAAKTPYLLDFEASWCGPCRQMDELVYTAQAVVDAAKGIVCIKVDGDQRRDLVQLHQVRGYPTGILFGPEGKEITRFLGYRNVRQMVAFLQGGRRTPDDMPAFIARVDALGREKSWSVLENEVAAWITDHPSQANDLRLTIAAGLGGMADPQAKGLAEKLLREVLATDSKSARALNTLAIIVGTSSRFDEAIQLNRELLTVDPDNARAMNDLAWVLSEEKGQYDKAMALAEKATARNPENPHILDTYGVVCFHLGRIQEAEKGLKDALRLMPPSSRGAVETRYHLAEVYETRGLNAEAADLFQRSLNLHNGLGGLTSRQASHAVEFLRQHPGSLLAGNSGAILSGTKDRPDQSSSEIPPVEADKLLRGTWGWDIDRGNDQDRGAMDLWWEQVSQSERYLVPQNGAQLAVIRDEPFAAVTLDDLRKAKFTSGRISASDAEPTIDVGTILGVRTTEGNLVKMEVLGFDPLQRGQFRPKYDMRLRYGIYRTGASQSMDQAVAKQQRPRVTSDANQPVDIGASIPVNDRKLHESFQGGLTRLIEDGKDTKIGVLLGQLQRSHCSLALPGVPARKLTLAELYQTCRRGVLVVGHLYNCKQCGRQHAIIMGGFVLTASGAIVTNYHVANQPDSLALGAMTADGMVYAVKEVLAADKESDVAILQLDGSGFTPLALSSEVSIGASAAVIDHPAGNFYTLTPGVISNHFTLDQNGPSTTWIATTADIGPGSSGAPLLNESGAVIGIASRRLAIPDSRAENHQPAPPLRAVNLFAPADAILRLVSPTPTVASKGSTGPALDRAERIQRQQTPVVTNQPSEGGSLGDLAFLVGGRRISGITSSGQVVPFPVASGIICLHGDEVYVAAGGNSRDSMVTVCNRAGAQLRTIPVPAEVRYFIGYVVLPDGGIAFLDNENDTIYFVDRTGKYLATARMREAPDQRLQNCDGVVFGNKLIVSEDGRKRLLAVDLATYEVTVFRDLRRLPGPWLGSIAFAEGKFYICTPNQVFSFSPDDPTERHVATLSEGIFNITGIAYEAGRLFVVANHAGALYEIDSASGTTKLVIDGLQRPEGIVVLPRNADVANQPAISTVRPPDLESVPVTTFLERPSTRKPKFVIPEENLKIPGDWQACVENLKRIDAAILRYRKDHGKTPDWLSDLVPGYLSQETLFCPKDPVHTTLYAPDPKLPSSYSWQLSSRPAPSGGGSGSTPSYRVWKDQQAATYGGVVPMVRCIHHGDEKVLNLSIDGQIYWSQVIWESLFRTRLAVRPNLSEASPSPRSRNPRVPATEITISGKVIDSQGAPVEDARVTFHQLTYTYESRIPTIALIQEAKTESTGVFTLILPQGRYSGTLNYVVVRKPGCALGWALWQTPMNQPLVIALDEPKDLAGDILDEMGQPVAEATVGITAAIAGKGLDRHVQATPNFLYAMTDNHGHFVFPDMPARATFEFIAIKPGRAVIGTMHRPVELQDQCQFSPGQAGIKVTMPPEARIEGLVVEKSSGQPVGGVSAVASARSSPGMYLGSKIFTTTGDGTFHIGGLTSGIYNVHITVQGRGSVAGLVAEDIQVDLKVGEIRNVKFELVQGGTIEVLVKDSVGRPIGQAYAHVVRPSSGESWSWEVDASGLARRHVQPGQYILVNVYKDGRAHEITPGNVQITVEAGETKRVECVVSESTPPIQQTQVQQTPRGASSLGGGNRRENAPSLVAGDLLEDFESYPLNTWPSSQWAQDGNARTDPRNNCVVQDPADPQNHVLRLSGVVGARWAALAYRPQIFSRDFVLRAKLYNSPESLPSEGHQVRGSIGLRTGTHWYGVTNPARELASFRVDGKIVTGTTVVGAYDTARWHDIAIHYRRNAQDVSLEHWLDGAYLNAVTVPITNQAAESGYDHIEITAQAGAVYFDDIRLCDLSRRPRDPSSAYRAVSLGDSERSATKSSATSSQAIEGANAIFTIFAPGQEPNSIAALTETLCPGKPEGVHAAKTAREALESSGGVLVLFLDRMRIGEFMHPESLAKLKERKVMGIGYGAAELFGALELQIQGGYCAHGGINPPPQIRIQHSRLVPQWHADTIRAFRIESTARPTGREMDYNFGVYLPANGSWAKSVEAIARSSTDDSYAPIAKQGNYVLVGLAAPAATWTEEYRSFFRAVADEFARTPDVPFSVAVWEEVRAGQCEFDLPPCRSMDEPSRREFHLHLTSPTRLSLILEHAGSEAVTMIFNDAVGPAEQGPHWVEKHAQNGETLRIDVNITREDIEKAWMRYWTLDVAHSDPREHAECKLRIAEDPKGPTEPILDSVKSAQVQRAPTTASPFAPGSNNANDIMFLVGGGRTTGITSSGQVMPFSSGWGTIRLSGNEIYVAAHNGRSRIVTVCDRAGAQVRTIPIPAEVRHFISYVVLPNGGIAFLDNQDDAIYFVDQAGTYLKMVRMRETSDNHLQNCDGVVVGGKLIVSEDGDKHLLAVDLITYEVTVFRDLNHLPGPWLGSITFGDGKFYVCTPDQVFSFSPDDPAERHVATLPEGVGAITGIACRAGRLFVVEGRTGSLYEIDAVSGTTKLVVDGLQYPEGVVVLPRTADTINQPAGNTVRVSDQRPGYPAPAFSGKDLKGNSIELSKEAGSARYVLLDFWASWCGPCREEFPYLRRLHAGYKNRGLRILGVNLDSNRDAAQRVAQENGLDYPHVFDGLGWKNAVAVQYRVHAIPQTYLLDNNLNIVAKNLRGPGLEQKIAALLGPANDEAIKMLKTKPVETHPPRAEAVSAQPYVNLNFDNDMLERSPASPSPGPGTCEYSGTGQCSVKPSLGNYSNKLLVLEDAEAGKKDSNFTVLPNNGLTGILSIEFDIVISDEVFEPNPEGSVMMIFSGCKRITSVS